MAGTVTITERRVGHLWRVKFTWVTSAGGAADGATTVPVTGKVAAAVQIPDAGGTQPDNAYDVTVKDADGVDVLNALGANLSNAAVTQKVKSDELGIVVNSNLTLGVTGGGAAKGGSTIVYLEV